MNTINLQELINNLCADDLVTLFNLIKSQGEDIVSSKTSNHQIIHREHTKESKHSCPHCGLISIVKNGCSKTKRQKYLCKDCKKSFSDTTNTIAYQSRIKWNNI